MINMSIMHPVNDSVALITFVEIPQPCRCSPKPSVHLKVHLERGLSFLASQAPPPAPSPTLHSLSTAWCLAPMVLQSRRALERQRRSSTTEACATLRGAQTHTMFGSDDYGDAGKHVFLPLPVFGPVLRSERSRQPFFLLPRHRISACVPLSRHRQFSDFPACTSNPCVTGPSKRVSVEGALSNPENNTLDLPVVGCATSRALGSMNICWRAVRDGRRF